MNSQTAGQLNRLNHQFYQTFARQFSGTRQRIQPGVARLAAGMPQPGVFLDLGCGNGELARRLAQQGGVAFYLGLDFSPGLLEIARSALDGLPAFRFAQADLTSTGWEDTARQALPNGQALPGGTGYNAILAFAVLHHLPGRAARLELLHGVHGLLQPGGRFIFSVWQFLNSEKLRNRITPWEQAGIPDLDLDEGDYLLDWRQGGYGLRYAHHFSSTELAELAAAAGFSVVDEFLSDGDGGRLGLYQVWK